MNKSTPLYIGGAALVLAPFVLVIGFVLLLDGGGGEDQGVAGCQQPAGVNVDPGDLSVEPVAGYQDEQLVNAAHIMLAGTDLGLSARDLTIGVMTAMGESSLVVLDHGDDVGPDSRGLFQQRDNGAWGTYEDRMDPHTSATMFFEALQEVRGRDTLMPTVAAHTVQRNADPYHYAPFWEPAGEVVQAIGDVDADLTAGGHVDICNEPPERSRDISHDGWAQPAAGPITSPFGYRIDPVTGTYDMHHNGTDLGGGGDGGAIWAAQDGTIIDAYTDPVGAWVIDIDHGGGLMTRYKHMWASGVLVTAGDEVSAGDQIGMVGSSGWSTGPHLHFEIHVDGVPVNPEQYLTDVGVNLG